MAVTPFMNLSLPVVSTTLGPEWASLLNSALEVVDSHDHSNGKGTQIKTAGLNINDDLSFNSYRALDLKSVKLSTQSATLTGTTNAQSLFSFNGNLYYTAGSGSAIQLTSGGSIISTPAALTTITYNVVNTNLVLTSASPEVFLAVDTTAPRTITLPTASTVAAGRVFIVKDSTGDAETNTLTILPAGSDTIDGQLQATLTSNFGALFLITNGIDRWSAL